MLQEGHGGRGGTSRVRHEGVVERGLARVPLSPWTGMALDTAPEHPFPPATVQGKGAAPRHGSAGLWLSWEAQAQPHLVLCPLLAAVALQPPVVTWFVAVLREGPQSGAPDPNPAVPPAQIPVRGGIADPPPSPDGFKTILMLSSLCQAQKCRNVAEIPSGKEFWGLCSTLGWRSIPPAPRAPRIPGILLARCPKLRAWRGASLALLPRAAQGLA